MHRQVQSSTYPNSKRTKRCPPADDDDDFMDTGLSPQAGASGKTKKQSKLVLQANKHVFNTCI